jgi:hypothetical protein
VRGIGVRGIGVRGIGVRVHRRTGASAYGCIGVRVRGDGGT